MSGEEKDRLDEQFKAGLENQEARFDFHEHDWDAMESLLDADKPARGIVYWLPRLGAVAAVLLAFFGWWFFKPQTVIPVQQQAAVVKKAVNPAAVTDSISNTRIADTKKQEQPAVNQNNKPETIAAKNTTPVYAGTMNKTTGKTVTGPVSGQHAVANNQAEQKDQSIQPVVNTTDRNDVLAAVNEIKVVSEDNSTALNSIQLSSDDKILAAKIRDSHVWVSDIDNHKVTVKGPKFKPQFGLAILAAPDINGVGSFKQSQVGTNIGMAFSVNVTKRLSFSTGASYSRKPYMTDFVNYHTPYQFKTDPYAVAADCRVLDIPLNVNYQVFSKNRNSFSLGTGLSSYIMLKESYNFDYADNAASTFPTNFTVVNRNQHILGVLNLNATYERAVSSKVSIAAQPYFKLPLTNIGSSEVRLQSTGVALGVKWNINR